MAEYVINQQETLHAKQHIGVLPMCSTATKSIHSEYFLRSISIFWEGKGKLMTAVLSDLVNAGPQRLWWTMRRPWQSARPLCSSWSCLAVRIPRNLPPHCRPLINLEGQISPSTFQVLWSLLGALHSDPPRLHPLFHLPREPPVRPMRALSRIFSKWAGAGQTATNRYETSKNALFSFGLGLQSLYRPSLEKARGIVKMHLRMKPSMIFRAWFF